MTFYQELQLNQAGSKAVIRNSQEKKDKFKLSAHDRGDRERVPILRI